MKEREREREREIQRERNIHSRYLVIQHIVVSAETATRAQLTKKKKKQNIYSLVVFYNKWALRFKGVRLSSKLAIHIHTYIYIQTYKFVPPWPPTPSFKHSLTINSLKSLINPSAMLLLQIHIFLFDWVSFTISTLSLGFETLFQRPSLVHLQNLTRIEAK